MSKNVLTPEEWQKINELHNQAPPIITKEQVEQLMTFRRHMERSCTGKCHWLTAGGIEACTTCGESE